MSEYLTGCSKCGSKMHTSPWCENSQAPSSLPDLNEINAFLTRMYKNPSRLALTGSTCAMMLAEQGNLEELRRMINQSLTYERGSVDETVKILKAQNAPAEPSRNEDARKTK